MLKATVKISASISLLVFGLTIQMQSVNAMELDHSKVPGAAIHCTKNVDSRAFDSEDQTGNGTTSGRSKSGKSKEAR